jgi:hypothetical protein
MADLFLERVMSVWDMHRGGGRDRDRDDRYTVDGLELYQR